jgi:formylglycine-generating enzyme required for sulfatase activity
LPPEGAYRRSGDRLFVPLDSVLEMEFVRVPAGEFKMGSDPKVDGDALIHELPQHRVTLDEYWIGRCPVTNAQYAAFCAASGLAAPEHFVYRQPPQGEAEHPVIYVSWNEAAAFCDWLGKRGGGLRLYLPSEAQW